MCLGFEAQSSILPKNDWHKYDRLDSLANMSPEEFEALVDQVLDVYEPMVQSHGAELVRNKLWDDPTVNASAQQEGTRWIVNMYGGLARRPEVTADGFSLVVCHELGHHLGGFPLKGERWAATEGQSDYFATQSCARAIWKNQISENEAFRLTVNEVARSQCDSVWQEHDDQNLCYRIAEASKSLATLLAAIGGSTGLPDFSTPDLSKVDRTTESHPAAQCRLDTYMNGATCTDIFDSSTIPGKSNPAGQSSVAAELEAAASSCMEAKGQITGLRSRCWFKPQLPFMALYPERTEWTENDGNGLGQLDPGDTAGLAFVVANRTADRVSDVVVKVESNDPLLNLLQSESAIGTIEAGEIGSTDQVVKAQISPSAKCGAKLPLTILTSSNRGSSTFDSYMTVGMPRQDDVGINQTPVAILNSAVVYSDLESQIDVDAARASVSVDLVHAYTSDVVLSLIAPDGSETLIARLPRVSPGEIKASYTVEMKGQRSLGKWRLKVEDTYRIDDGTLNSWSLNIESYVCR